MFIFTKKVLSWQTELSSLSSQIREAAKRYMTAPKAGNSLQLLMFF